MTCRWCITLDGPDARDRARAAVGILPRGTTVAFISRAALLGIGLGGVLLVVLVAAGLAR